MIEIVVTCRHKLRRRIKKCQAACADIKTLKFTEEESRVKLNTAKLNSKHAGLTIEEIVARFFKQLRNIDVRPHIMAAKPNAIIQCLEAAFLLGNQPYLKKYPDIRGRIRKLAAFYEAPRTVLVFLQKSAYKKFRKNIEVIEVLPQELFNISVLQYVAKNLNEDAKEHNHEDFSVEDLRAKFPYGEFKEEDGLREITLFCHAAVTLALFIRESMTTSPKVIEMGISEGVCWLCQQFFESLGRLYQLHIVATPTQGKIHPGWTIPTSTPGALTTAVQEIIQREIIDTREPIIRRRRIKPVPLEDRNHMEPFEKWVEECFEELWNSNESDLNNLELQPSPSKNRNNTESFEDYFGEFWNTSGSKLSNLMLNPFSSADRNNAESFESYFGEFWNSNGPELSDFKLKPFPSEDQNNNNTESFKESFGEFWNSNESSELSDDLDS